METFSALLDICAGNSPATDEFPAQRPVTRSFDVFFDLCLNGEAGDFRRRRAHYNVTVMWALVRVMAWHLTYYWLQCLSTKYEIPMLLKRKSPKKYGTCKAIEGHYRAGQKLLIIDDVLMTGGTFVEDIPVGALRQMCSSRHHAMGTLPALLYEGNPAVATAETIFCRHRLHKSACISTGVLDWGWGGREWGQGCQTGMKIVIL